MALLLLVALAAPSTLHAADSGIVARETLVRGAPIVLTLDFSYDTLVSWNRFGFQGEFDTYAPERVAHAIDIKYGEVSVLDSGPILTRAYLKPGVTYRFRITLGNIGGAKYEMRTEAGAWTTLHDSRNNFVEVQLNRLRVFATSLNRKGSGTFSGLDIEVSTGAGAGWEHYTSTPAAPAQAAESRLMPAARQDASRLITLKFTAQDWFIQSEAAPVADITQNGDLTLRSTASESKAVLGRMLATRNQQPSMTLRFKVGIGEHAGFVGFLLSPISGRFFDDPLYIPVASGFFFVGRSLYTREGSQMSPSQIAQLPSHNTWYWLRLTLGSSRGALYEWRTDVNGSEWQTLADTRSNGYGGSSIRPVFYRYSDGDASIDDLTTTNVGGFADNFTGTTLDLDKWAPVGYVSSTPTSVNFADGKVRILGTGQTQHNHLRDIFADQTNLQPIYDAMTARLNSLPYPREATLQETTTSISIVRDMSTLTFNRSNAMLDRANLRGFEIDEKMEVGNFLYVTPANVTYEQRFATDATMSHREEIPFYYLTGEFTPRTAEGAASPHRVRYEHKVDQMSGLIETTYNFSAATGTAQTRMLRIDNTMGYTPRELNSLYNDYSFQGRLLTAGLFTTDTQLLLEDMQIYIPTWEGNPLRRYLDLNNIDRSKRLLIESRRSNFCIWSDGYLGFQVLPITWKNTVIDSTAEETEYPEPVYKHLTPYIETDFRRGIAMTFVNSSTPIPVGPGIAFEQSFALMPARKPNVQSGFMNSNNQVPNMNYISHEYGYYMEWDGTTEEEVRRAAVEGTRVMDVVIANTATGWLGEAVTRYYNQLCRHYGMSTIMYTGDASIIPQYTLDGRPLSAEELRAVKVDYRLGNGPTAPERIEDWACKRHPLSAQLFLMNVFNIYEHSGNQGVFFDLIQYTVCSNTRHGCDLKGTYPLREAMQLMRDMVRLNNDYEPKHDLLSHGWDRHSFPKAALFDYTLPGEQTTGRFKLTTMEENIGYSTLLNGAACVLYEGVTDSYQYAGGSIIEQALRRVCVPFWTTSIHSSDQSPYALQQLRRYFLPLVIFDTTNSELHHPMDYNYAQYASASPDVDLMVYSRAQTAEALLVAVNVRRNRAAAELAVDLPQLGLTSGSLLLLDTTKTEPVLTRVESATSSFTLTRNLTTGPDLLLLKQDHGVPDHLWAQPFVFSAEAQWRGNINRLDLMLRAVPESDGQIWIYTAGRTPLEVDGGTLLAYDATSQVARIQTDLSSYEGLRQITVRF